MNLKTCNIQGSKEVILNSKHVRQCIILVQGYRKRSNDDIQIVSNFVSENKEEIGNDTEED